MTFVQQGMSKWLNVEYLWMFGSSSSFNYSKTRCDLSTVKKPPFSPLTVYSHLTHRCRVAPSELLTRPRLYQAWPLCLKSPLLHLSGEMRFET